MRPRKYDGPVKRIEAWIPYDIYKKIEEEKKRLGMAWSDFLLLLWRSYKTKSEGSK
ncbi:hypothetical protein [Pyrococcus kukulkanii]|uniref:CopG family transcriptional regulator n=2 Tax=Pyrococcus kukulkanii TaxID=1609559 RepID=A0ABV4T8H6_9EURY